jgi:hypothetical protein
MTLNNKRWGRSALLMAVLGAMFGLTGCSSPSSKPLAPLKDDFSRQEFDNGLQLFTYQVFFPVPKASPVERGDRTSRRRAASPSAKALRIDERLALRLEAESYCPDGFVQLERFTGVGRVRIRGECR